MKQYKKGYYRIDALPTIEGIEVYNYLEDSTGVTNSEHNIILRGTRNEEWVVTTQKLIDTYEHSDGSTISLEDVELYRMNNQWMEIYPRQDIEAPIIYAEQIPVPEVFYIETNWATLTGNRPGIEHEGGDWVCYSDNGSGEANLDDKWIVNGGVFIDTYVEI